MDLYAVYGAGGFGREMMYVARQQLRAQGVSPDQVIFVDDAVKENQLINGQRSMPATDFLALQSVQRHAVLAIANSEIRERLALRCVEHGIKLWSLCAETALIMDGVEIGEGAILAPFVNLTANIRIGKQFHANSYSYVMHDCVIGDFVTFAPGVKCNGNVVIEDHAYIGAGAVIKQGVPGKPRVIGRGAVIGMGAVVTRDVAPGVTVVGNPARPMSVAAKMSSVSASTD
ncbi:acetyltransferase [Pseudomonas sp. PA27(2017)]|uniref:acetyltransferase n=1 Tax=Pseudomonas sp. PA27(2017) TaxID=1932112 RepID=UPI00095D9876|nr:acetyltransferase [Pseudomonas sp. PA27(2017)]OLU33081.1 acetyltransferase [Pseudomonas sp. PA27(2017)]